MFSSFQNRTKSLKIIGLQCLLESHVVVRICINLAPNNIVQISKFPWLLMLGNISESGFKVFKLITKALSDQISKPLQCQQKFLPANDCKSWLNIRFYGRKKSQREACFFILLMDWNWCRLDGYRQRKDGGWE